MTNDQPTSPPPAPSSRPRWRTLLPDLRPYRSSPDFRLLWWAGAVTVFGSFLSFVAVPLQIKELTGSTFAVGVVGAVELVPLLVCGLYGGALADAVDKRRLIVWTEAALGLLSAALLLNSLLPHPLLWPLYLVVGLISALTGLQQPALDALVPQIVPHDQLTAAAALNSTRRQLAAVAAPSLAGLVIALAQVRTAYALDVCSFAVSVALLARLRPAPAAHQAEPPSLRAIVEGARYAWSRPELLGTYVVDIAAMLFAFPTAIYPFLADSLDAPWALGLLYASGSTGALVVTITSGWTSRVHRHGRMVVFAAIGWGLAITAAGWMRDIWLVLFFLVLAGGCDMVSGLFRHSIWDQTIPGELRGRLAGIELLSYEAGPQLGQVRAGTMASLTGVRPSVWLGGLACLASVGVLAAALPKLISYDVRTNEHAVRARQTRAREQARARDGGAAEAAPTG